MGVKQEEAAASAAADEARIKMEAEEKAAVATPEAHENVETTAPVDEANFVEAVPVKVNVVTVVNPKADPRFDFGPGFLTRCSRCRRLTKNRGDRDTRKVYCRSCYHSRATTLAAEDNADSASATAEASP